MAVVLLLLILLYWSEWIGLTSFHEGYRFDTNCKFPTSLVFVAGPNAGAVGHRNGYKRESKLISFVLHLDAETAE